MYWLTFRVRVTTPPQYGRNGTASLQITSRTQQARRCYRWCVRACVRSACVRACVVRAVGLADYCWALPRISSVAIATQPVHRLQIRPPNSAQQGGIPYHSPKLHPGPCNSVGVRPRTYRRHTDRQTHTDARDHNTFRVVYDSREM